MTTALKIRLDGYIKMFTVCRDRIYETYLSQENLIQTATDYKIDRLVSIEDILKSGNTYLSVKTLRGYTKVIEREIGIMNSIINDLHINVDKELSLKKVLDVIKIEEYCDFTQGALQILMKDINEYEYYRTRHIIMEEIYITPYIDPKYL